jgi:predicted transcriptional regulator with HTH domain
MSNYPDGWSRADEIAAGIEERYPGMEAAFELYIDELYEQGVEYYELTDSEQDDIRYRFEDEYADRRNEDYDG